MCDMKKRLFPLLAALALVAAPVLAAPRAAYADGIERPRQRVRTTPRPRPEPQLEGAPAPVPLQAGPETVTLPASFFADSSGGVGADISTFAMSTSTVVIRGGGASASAFAQASASARAGGRFGGGHHGGGCGCR